MVLFSDGAFPAEVTLTEGNYLEADFYLKRKIAQLENNARPRKQPSIKRRKKQSDAQFVCSTNHTCFQSRYSTYLLVIYDFLNAGFTEKFCD